MVKDSEIKALLDNVEANGNEINKVDLDEIKFKLLHLQDVEREFFMKVAMIAFGIFSVLSFIAPLMLFFGYLEDKSNETKMMFSIGLMLLFFIVILSQFFFNKRLITKLKKSLGDKKEKIKNMIVLNGGNVSIASYVMSLGSPVSEEGKIFQAFYLLNNEKYAGNFIDLQEPSILDKDEMIMEIAKANAMFNKAKEIMKS